MCYEINVIYFIFYNTKPYFSPISDQKSKKSVNIKFVEREILLQKNSKSKILLFRIPNFSIVFELEPKNETVLELRNEEVQQIVYYTILFLSYPWYNDDDSI